PKVCRPVEIHCHREVCCQVSKCIEECHMRQVCVPCCKDVVETCCKDVVKRICVPCTTYKTVTKRITECVDEPYDPCSTGGKALFRGLFSGLGRGHGCSDGCSDSCTTST